MHARVSYYDLEGAARDDVVRSFESTRGVIEQMPGNQGALLLVDPGHAKALSVSFWESEEALRATEEQADEVRQQSAGGANAVIRGVEVYEVALDFRS